MGRKKLYLFTSLLMILISGTFCSKDNDQSKQKQNPGIDNKSDRSYRIAVIDAQDAEPYKSARENMLLTLKKNGYEAGRNLEVYYASIGNDKNKGKDVLQDMMQKNPDVVFTNGTVITLAAKESPYFNIEKHKFVFSCVTDPVGIGVIDDFGIEPKFNFTGVSYPVPVDSRLKFVKKLIPGTRTIGLIYADMPQSQSYRKWVEQALKNDPDLEGIKVLFRSVPLITGEDGSKRMAEAAKKYVLELNKQVDVFLSPNDQMGVTEYFPKMVYATATKPLIGLGSRDVMERWGAAAAIYPSHASMGTQSGKMIVKLLEGKKIREIPAEWPKENGFAFDLTKTRAFKIDVPVSYIELAGSNIIK